MPLHLNITVMLTGYLLLMGCLALGLRILRRHPTPARPKTGGWPALIRQVLGTAIGGYVLLMAVVTGYYYGVARLGGRFLFSAFTGTALLIGLTLPLYLAASWLVESRYRRRRRGGPPAHRNGTRI